jgi:hypothetical protein
MSKSVSYSDAVDIGRNVPRRVLAAAAVPLKLFFDTTGEPMCARRAGQLWALALGRAVRHGFVHEQGQAADVRIPVGQRTGIQSGGNADHPELPSLPGERYARAGDGRPDAQAGRGRSHLPRAEPDIPREQRPRTHVVEQRETLDLIAWREYGDAAEWRFIAEVNNIDSPLAIRPGTVLSASAGDTPCTPVDTQVLISQ